MSVSTGGLLAFIAISMGILKPVTCIFTEKVISGDLGLLRGQDMFQALIREHFTMDTKHNPSLDQGCVMNYLGSVPSEEKQMPVQMVQTLRGRRDMSATEVLSENDPSVGFENERTGVRARRAPLVSGPMMGQQMMVQRPMMQRPMVQGPMYGPNRRPMNRRRMRNKNKNKIYKFGRFKHTDSSGEVSKDFSFRRIQ
nr:PREDICTED: uncharacterized protein LOC109043934 isoform X1 [Bemisia tabaci]